MRYLLIPLIAFLVCLFNFDAILSYILHSNASVKAIICFTVVIPIHKFMTKIALRVYVREVYCHCWRLICHLYRIDNKKGDYSSYDKADTIYKRIKPWISRHNMHFYKECILIRYETIANPLFPGHGVETHCGLSAQRMAYHILYDITKDNRLEELPYWTNKKVTRKERFKLIMGALFNHVDDISR